MVLWQTPIQKLRANRTASWGLQVGDLNMHGWSRTYVLEVRGQVITLDHLSLANIPPTPTTHSGLLIDYGQSSDVFWYLHIFYPIFEITWSLSWNVISWVIPQFLESGTMIVVPSDIRIIVLLTQCVGKVQTCMFNSIVTVIRIYLSHSTHSIHIIWCNSRYLISILNITSCASPWVDYYP